MIRKLLMSTAIASLVATGAVAQSASPSATPSTSENLPAQQETERTTQAEGHLASDLMGETVYNSAGEDAEAIGDVNDLVIGEDGEVTAIVVGVGGFLGVGDKEVSIRYDAARWAQREGERQLVIETTEDELKQQQAFDRSAYEPGQASAEAPEESPEQQAAVEESAGSESDRAAAGVEQGQRVTGETTAAIGRTDLREMPTSEIRAERLLGTAVYGASEDHIGEVGDVVLTENGDIDSIIVDVGGFLGIGEKAVAMAIDNLTFMVDGNEELHLYTRFTQEELESRPTYVPGSAQQSDETRGTGG